MTRKARTLALLISSLLLSWLTSSAPAQAQSDASVAQAITADACARAGAAQEESSTTCRWRQASDAREEDGVTLNLEAVTDLNGDSHPDYVVWIDSMMGAGPNLPGLVYVSTGPGAWRFVGEIVAGTTPTVLAGVHGGLRDIQAWCRESCCEHSITVYRFGGTEYRAHRTRVVDTETGRVVRAH